MMPRASQGRIVDWECGFCGKTAEAEKADGRYIGNDVAKAGHANTRIGDNTLGRVTAGVTLHE